MHPDDPRLYPYVRSRDQDAPTPVHHPVVIVGAGPVGLALALDLGLRGTPALVLDDREGVGTGSRAICFSRRTLEIADRLGVGEALVAQGVEWNLGRVFRDTREIYSFNLSPDADRKRPAFINLPQPRLERSLVERIAARRAGGDPVEIRGAHRVTGIEPHNDHVRLTVRTPEGDHALSAGFVVAADGANSALRDMLGLGFEGRVFQDNFLIADIRMHADVPVERRFWFDPPFNRGQTALMHRQPGDLWRLDFQLGPGIDRAAELDPARVQGRVRAMIGPDIGFTLDWTSIYTFRCCTMENYRHGRVIFAGDAAHQVSPFGARGANGGIQDADNLGWKLAMVVAGTASERLLDSYHAERKAAALENILNSTRTADFLTPRGPAHALFRDAVLDLAESLDFARPLVNSGRLSVPATYDGSPLNGPDDPALPAQSRPGSAMPDAPVPGGWLLDRVAGGFSLLAINTEAPDIAGLAGLRIDAAPEAPLARRYLGSAPRAVYLLRPDSHVAARWRAPGPADIAAALSRATGG